MSSLDFLIWLEQFRSPVADTIMVAFSLLGSEEAYMAVLATTYLCIGHRLGFHMLVIFLASVYSNSTLKHAFNTVRPSLMHPGLLHPMFEVRDLGPALPSGHAQNAAAVWGLVGVRLRSRTARIIPAVLIVGIAFSRLYCHVHWPADVLSGLGIGLAIVMVYIVLIGAWELRGMRWPNTGWLLLVVSASLVLFLLGMGIDACVRSAGTLLGAGIGFIFLELRGYRAQASAPGQILKVAIALVTLFVLRQGIKDVLGGSDPANYLRYAVMAFTLTYLLPLLFSGWHNWRTRARRSMELLEEEEPSR